MNGRIIRNQPLGARLPVLGKIKIGGKTKNQNGKEYPVSYDYFVVDEKSKYAELFKNAYGEKPNKLEIVFISDNNQDVCNERYELWDEHGRKICDGDGAVWKCYNPKTNEYDEGLAATPAEIQSRYPKARLSVVLTLQFILPKIPGVFGVWSLTTRGAKSSIVGITTTFDQVQLNASTVVNIPFDLIVEKVKSLKPGAQSVFPVISLIPNISKQSIDLLNGFFSEGLVPRGMLNDDIIKTIAEQSKNAILLEEHIESAAIVDEVTGEIVDEDIAPEKEVQVENRTQAQVKTVIETSKLSTATEQSEIWELAKSYKLTAEDMKLYLHTAFKIGSFKEIKAVDVVEIKYAISEGFVRKFIEEREAKKTEQIVNDLPF